MSIDIKSMIEIAQLENEEYCLVFRPLDVGSPLDGHTWSLLVQAYCYAEKVLFGDVVHDPESDMYSAISARKEQLEEISGVIEKLSSDTAVRQKLLAQIEELEDFDDDMTTEEFLEWMATAGFDMSVPQLFDFGLDSFQDVEQATSVQAEIEHQGYRTDIEVIDDEVFFDINVITLPTLSSLQKIEHFLKTVALKYEVKYIGFGVEMQDGIEIT